MKTGRSLQEVMLELDRQNKAKKDSYRIRAGALSV